MVKGINYWDNASNAYLEMSSPVIFIGMTGDEHE